MTVQDKWANPDNELLPQTREGWIAKWQAYKAEWERIFEEEKEFPIMDEVAQQRSQAIYNRTVKRLQAAQDETE